MINNVTLVGRLTRDPELRKAGDIPVCSFTLAVDRDFLNGEGERETDFIPVVTWRKLAEACANNLKKGRLVGVTGRILVREWEQEGKKSREKEVVADSLKFLDRVKKMRGSRRPFYLFPFSEVIFWTLFFDIPGRNGP